jgi:hypothetical protein
VPLGYLKTHEHEIVLGSGTVIPDPEHFAVVKRTWQEALRGTTNLSEIWRKARYEWGLASRPTKGNLLGRGRDRRKAPPKRDRPPRYMLAGKIRSGGISEPVEPVRADAKAAHRWA